MTIYATTNSNPEGQQAEIKAFESQAQVEEFFLDYLERLSDVRVTVADLDIVEAREWGDAWIKLSEDPNAGGDVAPQLAPFTLEQVHVTKPGSNPAAVPQWWVDPAVPVLTLGVLPQAVLDEI